MREFLKGLELDKEIIDTIMAEHGKLVTEDKEKVNELKDQVKEYEAKIVELEEMSSDSEKLKEELTTLKTQLEEEENKKKEEEDYNLFVSELEEVIGERKFVNEFTKEAIVKQMRELVDSENTKTKKEIFEELTKDKDGLFVNPQAPTEMDGANENLDGKLGQETKEIPLIW